MAELSTFTPTNAPSIEPIRQRPESNIYTAMVVAATVVTAMALGVVLYNLFSVLGGL